MTDFKIVCITNRHFFDETADFLTHIDRLAAARPDLIILREKDLPVQAYTELAKRVIDICERHGVVCALHTYIAAAIALKAEAFHAPMPVLDAMTDAEKHGFIQLGASTHSVEQARAAEAAGCTYITASHIYDTDCKKGLPGRGLKFLEDVTRQSAIPVYALGGIDASKLAEVRRAGADGACVMSGAMTCADPARYIASLHQFSK